MLGRTVRRSKEQLKALVKNMDRELRGLEERSLKGGNVKRSEMDEIKMNLSVLEVLL